MSIFENPFKKTQQSQEKADENAEEKAVAASTVESSQFRTADNSGMIHTAESQREADMKAAEANRTY